MEPSQREDMAYTDQMSDDNNLTTGERNTLLNMADDCSAIASDPSDLAMIESYRYLLQRSITAADAFNVTAMLRRSMGRLKKGPPPGRVGSADRMRG